MPATPNTRRLRALRALAALCAACLAMALVAPVAAFGVPAFPQTLEAAQPDGTAFTYRTVGDEHFQATVDADGFLLQADPEGGAWRYVRNGSSGFELAGTAGSAPAPADALTAADLADDAARAAYKALGGQPYEPLPDAGFDLVTLDDIDRVQLPRRLSLLDGDGTAPTAVKTIPLVAIVIGFSDFDYSASFNWAGRFFADDDSVARFYEDMSLGKFTFSPAAETCAYDGHVTVKNSGEAVGDGIIHVTLDRAHGTWGLLDEDAEAEDLRDAFEAALTAADPYIDFASFDADGSGAIDQDELAIAFVVAGYEGAAVGRQQESKSLWSHAWSLKRSGQTAPRYDGVALTDYVAISEYLTGSTQEPMGVITHELGHYLGLPDLYDTAYLNATDPAALWHDYEVGYLSLMASGSWGSRTVDGSVLYGPTPLDAWSRVTLGWVEPTVAAPGEADAAFTLASQDSAAGYNVVKIAGARADECYLVENREFAGWDLFVADQYVRYDTQFSATSGGGLLLWHVDEAVMRARGGDNEVNVPTHRPALMPLFPEGAYVADADGDSVHWENLLTFRSTIPNTDHPFLSKHLWDDYYPNGDGGQAPLDLPLYGATDASASDEPDERVLSGVRVAFPSDFGDAMTLTLLGTAADDSGGEGDGGGGGATSGGNETGGGSAGGGPSWGGSGAGGTTSGGSGAGGGSDATGGAGPGSDEPSEPEGPVVTQNEDGSTTTVTTDVNGDTVAVTQGGPDGSTVTVTASAVTGRTTTEVLLATGVDLVVEQFLGQTVSAQATVPEPAASAARATGDAVQLPFDPAIATGVGATVQAPVGTKLALPTTAPADLGWVVFATGQTDPSPDGVHTLAASSEPLAKSLVADGAAVFIAANPVGTYVVASPALRFSDVTAGSWYANVAAGVGARKIINGHPGAKGLSEFRGGKTMTRAMVAAVLYNIEDGSPAANAGFPDVRAGAWYADCVGWAKANGLVMGSSTTGRFDPEGDVTREQLVTILERYARYLELDTAAPADALSGFRDAGALGYGRDAMAWAVDRGIVHGYPDATLRGSATATRAEVSAIFMNFIELLLGDRQP